MPILKLNKFLITCSQCEKAVQIETPREAIKEENVFMEVEARGWITSRNQFHCTSNTIFCSKACWADYTFRNIVYNAHEDAVELAAAAMRYCEENVECACACACDKKNAQEECLSKIKEILEEKV